MKVGLGNPTVYIVDPLGCVRAYSEILSTNLAKETPAKLLTTGLTFVRGPIDRGDNTVDRFFLRLTATISHKVGGIRERFIGSLGLAEYCLDLFRLRKLKRDGIVFHWQWIPVPALTLPLLALFRIPIDVLTSHDLILSGPTQTTPTWMSRAVLKRAQKVIFHSAKLQAEAIARMPHLEGKTQVIPHELLFEGEGRPIVARQKRTIGVVGLLRDYKGLEILLEAWRLVETTMNAKGVSLRIAGDCRLSNAHRASLINLLNATPGVQWSFGYLSEEAFKAELGNLDLLVLPYSHCSQSGVALAAFGLGVPLLVSDAGGLPELLSGGQEPWIFQAGDIAALAAKLADFAFVSDGALIEYRRWMRDRASLYGKDVIVKAHLSLYESLRSKSVSSGIAEEAR